MCLERSTNLCVEPDAGTRVSRSVTEGLGSSFPPVFSENLHGSPRARPGRTLTFLHQAPIILVCRFVDPAERGCMGTFTPSALTVTRQWHIIDAQGQVLGRIATVAATVLQGR